MTDKYLLSDTNNSIVNDYFLLSSVLIPFSYILLFTTQDRALWGY